MIVTPCAGGHLVVTQSDHARYSADLLALFRAPEIAASSRRASILRAVAEHDNGWWEVDAAPIRNDACDAPRDFREMAASQRHEVFRRGVERHAAQEPDVAARIAGHGIRLSRKTELSAPAREEFLSWMVGRRLELAEEAGLDESALSLDDDWLELADQLSLVAATGDVGFLGRAGWKAEAAFDESATAVAIWPFPLAGATTLELSCRWLGPGKFASDAALGRSLAAARWLRRPIRFAPRLAETALGTGRSG